MEFGFRALSARRKQLVKIAIVVGASLLTVPAPASANPTDFSPSPTISPLAGQEIYGFTQSGAMLFRLVGPALTSNPSSGGNFDNPVTAQYSEDGGSSWQNANWPLPTDYTSGNSNLQALGASVAPDGAVWISARGTTRPWSLLRFDPAAKTWTAVVANVDPSFRMSAPKFVGGSTLLALAKSSTLKLVAVNTSNGSAQELAANSATGTSGLKAPAQVSEYAGRIYARTGMKWYVREGANLISQPGGPPFREDKGVVYGPVRVEAPQYSAFAGLPVRPVEGDGELVISNQGFVRDNGGPTLELLTGVPPAGTNRFMRLNGRLIAFLDLSLAQYFSTSELLDTGFEQTIARVGSTFFEYSGTPVPAATINGNPSAVAREYADQLNMRRAQAGLGPAILDEAMSVATENHSRYWTLNKSSSNLPSVHYEEPGKPGFTGADPSDRCVAAGASVDSCGEVMFGGMAPAAAVDGWLVTPYHGRPLNSPRLTAFGGGKVGSGPAVMALFSSSPFGGSFTRTSGLKVSSHQIRPSGFPNNVWDGSLQFDSGENPDPLNTKACIAARVEYPAGVTITGSVPSGDIDSIGVVRTSDGAQLEGCPISLGADQSSFIPRYPLSGGETYQATVKWTPTGEYDLPGPQLSYSWSFLAKGPKFANRCRASIRAKAARKGRRAVLTMRICSADRLRVYRMSGKRKRKIKQLGKRALTRSHGRVIVKLPRRGRVFKLRVELYKGKRAMKRTTRTVRIRSTRR